MILYRTYVPILCYDISSERAVPSESNRENRRDLMARLTALLLAAATLLAFAVILILVIG